MTRHLLALIALISGLAALNAPAQASLVEALGNDIGVSADASHGSASEACPCEAAPKKLTGKCRDKDTKPPRRELPSQLRLPVLMGVERAYE